MPRRRDDDYDDDPRRRVGHGTSAFATMFGGSVGCATALGLLGAIAFGSILLVCAGCGWMGCEASKRGKEERERYERQQKSTGPDRPRERGDAVGDPERP